LATGSIASASGLLPTATEVSARLVPSITKTLEEATSVT
jgi:hypothetical protein